MFFKYIPLRVVKKIPFLLKNSLSRIHYNSNVCFYYNSNFPFHLTHFYLAFFCKLDAKNYSYLVLVYTVMESQEDA